MLLSIFLWIIGLFALYIIIKAAIDDSSTAREIREIRKLMQSIDQKVQGSAMDPEKEKDDLKNYEIIDIPYDKCPACGSQIAQTDTVCPSCGLSLDGKE